jgi:hypothetical protein
MTYDKIETEATRVSRGLIDHLKFASAWPGYPYAGNDKFISIDEMTAIFKRALEITLEYNETHN